MVRFLFIYLFILAFEDQMIIRIRLEFKQLDLFCEGDVYFYKKILLGIHW